MKNTTTVTDFKDLRKAIEEIQKNQPAETRYQQQAKKMGYTKDKSIVVEQTLVEKNLMPEIQKIVDTKGAAKVGGVGAERARPVHQVARLPMGPPAEVLPHVPCPLGVEQRACSVEDAALPVERMVSRAVVSGRHYL